MAEQPLRCDVVVVGTGPAGLAAAYAAASHRAEVVVVDQQPCPGGQVWRRDVVRGVAPSRLIALQTALRDHGVKVLSQSEVAGCSGRRLFVRGEGNAASIDYGALVLATGARELLLPFPGWTLPGVTGAGGAQALAKQGWPMRNKRVLVAGSGPLLLASADTLQRHGAHVLGIHEQAPLRELAMFAAELWRWPSKAWQAVGLRTSLWRIPYRAGSHVVRALGDDHLRAVELNVGGHRKIVECDQLACGFGLVPNVELAQMLGCRLDDGRHPQVRVDQWQRSSADNVFAAGEACGIGGIDCALVEGEIAGHAAAGQQDAARGLFSKRAHARRFADVLRQRFLLHDGLRALADDDTILCRCEDVTMSAVGDCAGARETKLMTRCGMGACQGRICGTALAEISGIARAGFRSPMFPVSLDVLSGFLRDPADPTPGVSK